MVEYYIVRLYYRLIRKAVMYKCSRAEVPLSAHKTSCVCADSICKKYEEGFEAVDGNEVLRNEIQLVASKLRVAPFVLRVHRL